MKLDSIDVTNYRQFKGAQKIDFSTDPDNRVTIIQGKIGTGKTFLLDAMRWCLYGEEYHPRKSEEPLLNTQTLKNMEMGEVESVSIGIKFSQAEAPKYQFIRRVDVKKTEEGLEKVGENFRALETTSDGVEKHDPEFLVNKFLPKKIHQFFLFAGEDIVKYFTEGSGRDVKDAVTNVSQIDLIEDVIDHCERFLDKLSRQTTDVSELEEINSEIENLKSKIQEKEEEWSDLEKSIKNAEKKMTNIEAKLGSSSAGKAKEDQEELTRLNEKHSQIEDEIEELRTKLSEKILEIGPRAYLKETISNVLSILEEKGDVELPPPIQELYLDSLIDSEKCICDRPLEGDALEAVKELKEKKAGGKVEILGLDGKYKLHGAKNRLDGSISEIRSLRKKISGKQEELEKVGSRAKKVKEKIETSGDEEAKKLLSRHDKLKNLKNEAVRKSGEIEAKVDSLGKKKEKLDKKKARLVKKNAKNKEVSNLYKLFENSKELAEDVKREILDEVRKKAEKETERIFQEVHWKETYEGLRMSSNFEITPRKKDGWEGGALSGGERIVLALSFVAGLQKITGFDFPIVMDSPLAQWSGEPRRDFVGLLDEYSPNKQLVFLLKDTEYTEDLQDGISDYIGKEFKLDFSENTGSTEIREV